MKCPIDQTEMEKGALFAQGQFWLNKLNVITKVWPGLGINGLRVNAWKCPKCGKIELYVE